MLSAAKHRVPKSPHYLLSTRCFAALNMTPKSFPLLPLSFSPPLLLLGALGVLGGS